MTGTKQTIYLRFVNDELGEGVYMRAGEWATAFRIIANADLDIYIQNEGNTTIIAGSNHYGIELQSKGEDITVNLYVSGYDSFSPSGGKGACDAEGSGTCHLINLDEEP